HCVYSRTEKRAKEFADEWGIPRCTTDMKEAIEDAETDVVVIGLPNNLHKEAIQLAAAAGKAILCTKPLALTGEEALDLLKIVEDAGVFHGYLEDLCYPPKTLKAVEAVQKGAIGQVTWTRAREAHPGPHSDWFWDPKQSGGGAILDLGCHCIEIGRNYIGKDVRPLEVMCWADTLVKPINAEDNAIALIRYETGAVSQIEVSWTFRGGMELKDEVAGTEGTIRIDHWLRTGFEIFTAGGTDDYVAEKSESESGWLFPVGDEVNALGYTHMFTDMLDALDNGKEPMETFYDGYVVNAIMDACYASAKSKKWEPVQLPVWRGGDKPIPKIGPKEFDDQHWLIKEEKMPDGKMKVILKEKSSGAIIQRIEE
ncbi:MAG: Gfo/Idh/MocA family oxidoreductase, partial [Saprospiraceae bacterium]|nr:Gfo/Idh/MocA family oxidoreductase [Saprospiraceae bacterium]